jgi:hypothetical protein
MRVITRLTVVLAGAAAVLSVSAGALAGVHPSTSNQYCFASAQGCIRIQNNGGNGSAVVVGATDINGPAENASFNPTTTYNFHGQTYSAGTVQFTGHTNECLALDSQLVLAKTAVCNATGTIWVPVNMNGAIQWLSRPATEANGADSYLEAPVAADGTRFRIAGNGQGFERFKSCSGNC